MVATEKVVIYGAGQYLKENSHLLPKNHQVVAYVDSNPYKATSFTGQMLKGCPVFSPNEVSSVYYDKLFICTDIGTANRIFSNLKNFDVPPEKVSFLYREDGIFYLQGDGKWRYKILPDWSIESRFGDVVILEKGGSDYDTVGEIFYRNTYFTDIKPNTIVIDWGMNIGVASLFFAGQKNVDAVYGFEPFLDTYQRACENIELNPSYIKTKIKTYNCAVTDKNEEKYVAVDTDYMGWRRLDVVGENNIKVKIVCRKATDVLEEIITKNKRKNYLLKIDVEGSEYEIFNILKNTDVLESIDTIVMEYHRGPKKIVSILEKFGFRYLIQGGVGIGILTAFRC